MKMYLTGLHALKSASPYDYAHNIAETTHTKFRFTFYDEQDEPERTEGAIVSNDELYRILNEAGLLKEG